MSDAAPEPTPENADDDACSPIFNQDGFELAEQMLAGISDGPARPDNFFPYRFIGDEPLGAGNIGDVWLAEDTASNRLVAIKFLRHTSEPDVWATRETHRLGALEHRYIARLYVPGVLEDGTPWLAMEYVEGEPLDKYCKGRNSSIQERLALFRAVCEAVQYAHSRQIVHGDLKPSNIRVKPDGEPKLLDFGLAQQFRNPEATVTQSPSALGFTPAYAAPEQFRGEPIGVYIDVYALGVILYELLTETLPFEASRCTVAEMEKASIDVRVPKLPSAVADRAEREHLRKADWRDLDAICLKALASGIDARYSSVEALVQDLDHYTNFEPLAAKVPHSAAYRIGKFATRYRSTVAAASAALFMVAGLVGFFTYRLANERNRALAEAARTQKVKQFFLDTFSHATEDAQIMEKTRFAALFLDRGVRDAESLAQDPALQEDVYEGFGAMYLEWGALDRAEQIARRALATAQTSVANDRTRVARAQLALGNVLQERGKYTEALAIANDALSSQLAKVDYPIALTLLANTYLHLGNFSLADTLNQQALKADQALYGWNSGKVADDLMNLGNIQVSRGQYRTAETDFRQAVAINESVFGKESAQAADSASYVAQALYFQGGKEKEEAAIIGRALAILERTRGDADSRVAFTLAQMGANALEFRDLDGAEKAFSRAAEIYRAARGDEHQSVAIELANVASVYLEKKQYVRAEEAFRDVIRRLANASLPSDNINVGIARIKLGHSLLGQKRYADSETELLNGYTVVKKQADPSVSWLTKARKDLAEVYDALKQPEKAAVFRAELATSPAHSE